MCTSGHDDVERCHLACAGQPGALRSGVAALEKRKDDGHWCASAPFEGARDEGHTLTLNHAVTLALARPEETEAAELRPVGGLRPSPDRCPGSSTARTRAGRSSGRAWRRRARWRRRRPRSACQRASIGHIRERDAALVAGGPASEGAANPWVRLALHKQRNSDAVLHAQLRRQLRGACALAVW
jgi:hypothetical protein